MFNTIKKIFGMKTKSINDFIPLSGAYNPLNSLSSKDYLKLYFSWIYSATTTIANSISDLEYHILSSKDGKDINHKYKELITCDLLKSISSFLKINGECFLYKSMAGSTVTELILLRPDFISREQNFGGDIVYYRYSAGGKAFRFTRDQLIIFKNFTPYDTLGNVASGIGDIQAIAEQANTDKEVVNWNANFFINNASAGDIIEAEDNIDNEVKERFSTAWNNKFRGTGNGHKLAILDGGLKFIPNSRSQKEMDFVEQRRFTRDEILGIFKVPKAIIGLGEGVNVGNVKAFEMIYAKRTIKPLATQIAETFNKDLFDGTGYLEFINIVPTDQEELVLSLNSGGITINEYRNKIGLLPLDNGNILKINPFQVSEPVNIIDNGKKILNKKEQDIYEKIDIKNILSKNIKGTEEYEQKRWEQKIQRNNVYEYKYNKQLQKIFKIQEEDILKQINNQKSVKKPEWNELKYLTLYHTLIGPIQRDLVQEEGDIAFEEINIDAVFQIGATQTTKWLRSNIDKFAKEIDKTTKNKIFDEIDKGNKQGLGATEISKNVSGKFNILKTSRAESIVRTETIRASSYATQKAWEDSGVVESKKWWTSRDERVCPSCGPLHGRTIGLKEDFYKKGDISEGGLNLDYSNTPASPLHPKCRCSIIAELKKD